MKCKMMFLFLLLMLTFASKIGLAETTRIGTEFFAFRHVSVAAVKDGAMWKAEQRARMGVLNGRFSVDFSTVTWVPAPCRQVYAAALPRQHHGAVLQVAMPPTSTIGKSGQNLTFPGTHCSLSIWLIAPQAADQYVWGRRSGLASVPVPDSPSVIFGLIEVRSDKERNTVEFVVGARDV